MTKQSEIEEVKRQMKDAFELLGSLIKENEAISLRAWASALAKGVALMYNAQGFSHNRFACEMGIMVEEYECLWDEGHEE